MPIQTLLPYDVNQRNAAHQGAAGLNEQLDRLINQQTQKMQQARAAEGYQKGYNLSPEQAQLIASQSPEFQANIIKALNEQQQAQAFNREISPNKGGMQGLQSGLQPQGQPDLGQTMQALGGQPSPLANNQPQGQQSIADILSNRPLNPNLQAKAEEIKERRRQNDISERTSSYKINKKGIEAIHDEAAQAEKDIQEIKKAKRYNATGQLIQGPTRDVLEKLGLENIITNEPTEVTAKIIAGLTTGVAEAYGMTPRSQLYLQKYEATLPRMVNSKEGFDAVADNKILEREAVPIVNKELRKLEHKYKQAGQPYPLDILELARENAKPETDKLIEQSDRNIDKFIERQNAQAIKSLPPASQNKDVQLIDATSGIMAKSDGKKWSIRAATPEELAGEGENNV